MSPSVRQVPTASGATAVQIIWRYRNRKPEIEHVGSAHTDHELAALMVKAQRLVDDEQIYLDLGVLPSPVAMSGTGTVDSPVTVSGERVGLLLDAICGAFQLFGLDAASGEDEVFFNLVQARIISPGSKFDSIETLAEVGVKQASYKTIQRRRPRYAGKDFRDQIAHALATHAAIVPCVDGSLRCDDLVFCN